LTDYLKYLLSHCLAFGVVISDGILDSHSNAARCDQVSYAQERKDFNNSESYLFKQISSSDKTSLPNPLAQLQLLDICSNQFKVLLKLRLALYQNISTTKAQQVFLATTISSSNPYSSLYIA
jgi:hypothetical protein